MNGKNKNYKINNKEWRIKIFFNHKNLIKIFNIYPAIAMKRKMKMILLRKLMT
jgi:hypothetical protein